MLAEVPEGPSAVEALSFGSQLDGMVVCDAKGEPLRPAMIWMDRRAEPQAAAVAARLAPADFYHHTGANLDSSHAVFKALWVRDEEPEVFAEAAHLMPPGSYVLREAAGVLAVDWSNASSLALLDPRTRAWSAPVLDAVGVEAAMLPELPPGPRPSGRSRGPSPSAPACRRTRWWWSAAGTRWRPPWAPGCSPPARCATSSAPPSRSAPRRRSRGEDPAMLVECHPHADPDVWLLENPGFVSGGNLRWWRDQFAPLERAAEAGGQGDAYDLLTGPAAQVPPGAEGLVFLPCMQGAMAPEWNGAARGVFSGLTLAHTRAHMTRALLEGSAYALRDILEGMGNAGLDVRRLTIVGGGAKGALWRQIKADVTGLPVRVPTSVETTATGAAILAAVGAGVHPSVADAVCAFVAYQPDEHVPDPESRQRYDDAYRRYRDVYFALKPVFEG